MKENILLKLLASIPIILIALYFIPFLGICLLILRLIINKHKIFSNLSLIIMGIILAFPQLLAEFLNSINFELSKIPYLNQIVNSTIYNNNIIKYSHRLLIIGTIFLIITVILKIIFRKIGANVNSFLNNYIRAQAALDAKISQENDLIMRQKRENAKNTNYVKCPYCGSDNIVSAKNGRCQYCRRTLKNPQYHE